MASRALGPRREAASPKVCPRGQARTILREVGRSMDYYGPIEPLLPHSVMATGIPTRSGARQDVKPVGSFSRWAWRGTCLGRYPVRTGHTSRLHLRRFDYNNDAMRAHATAAHARPQSPGATFETVMESSQGRRLDYQIEIEWRACSQEERSHRIGSRK